MGLGNERSMDPKERLPNFEYYTRLSLEMSICKNYLHKPHSYFKSLSKEDQLKLRLFEEWERKRTLAEQKKIDSEMKLNKMRNTEK